MDYDELARDGLILFDRIRDVGADSRALRRDAERGILVKLRRGAYVSTSVWEASSSRERHLLRARAVLAASVRPVALAGVSAAAVWGMPIDGDWPAEVTVLDEWQGGGRSEPGVRRTASGFRTAITEFVDEIPVTSVGRTAIDVARSHSFSAAIGSLDWALWRRRPNRLTKEDLFAELNSLNPRFGRRHLLRCVGFCTHLSDSFGESKSRSVIHSLGFDAPELQVEFTDGQGTIVPDYFWRSAMVAGEFDGKAKYTRNVYTRGDPGEVVWREKKREDRLRRMVSGVTRILSSDVGHPARLESLLLEAAVPHGGRTALRREL
ncbi:MAG: hypothetical protein V4479_00090 [Actinomycetota bacterium]